MSSLSEQQRLNHEATEAAIENFQPIASLMATVFANPALSVPTPKTPEPMDAVDGAQLQEGAP